MAAAVVGGDRLTVLCASRRVEYSYCWPFLIWALQHALEGQRCQPRRRCRQLHTRFWPTFDIGRGGSCGVHVTQRGPLCVHARVYDI